MNKVYCTNCKYLHVFCDSFDIDYSVCNHQSCFYYTDSPVKSHKTRRTVIIETSDEKIKNVVDVDYQYKNRDNNCPDYVPSFWHRLFGRKP